jgi:hypothetical protein
MLARLLNNMVFNFYKTKWTKPLKRDRTKSFQIPIHRWIIVRGDKVKIRSGPDRGKIGRVVKVIRKLNRVVVKGVNITSYMKSSNSII